MTEHFDAVVIGSGPAGQKAAISMTKSGRSVLLVDRTSHVGGACVRNGTIPSKTLREVAVTFDQLRRLTGREVATLLGTSTPLSSLMARKHAVIEAHEGYMQAQLARNGIVLRRAIATFRSPQLLELTDVHGNLTPISAQTYFIATGSSPRDPDNVSVDHQHVLDSDSILSLTYLPQSMLVLGSGVIACEYASIFSALGVQVTMVHSYPGPLGFLDADLVACFLDEFSARGGKYLGDVRVESAAWNGLDAVAVTLADGRVLSADKVLCALGRAANVQGLGLEHAGVTVNERGNVEVDTYFRTSASHIYAIGDVIGPPSLASTSMEQGRRAAQHALGAPVENDFATVPASIFTIPEISSVGLTQAQAVKQFGSARVGTAHFAEVARGQISDNVGGRLKLICDPDARVVGAQIAGDGASELVHVAQMAILGGLFAQTFVDEALSFPTLAEAFRIAALDLLQSKAHLELLGAAAE